ncbi:MAG: RNA polymerase sigma factor [Acidimicrobiales bacterium]
MSSRSTIKRCEWEYQVSQALDGSEPAWRELVDNLSDVAWKVLNSYDLNPADREEAFAATFFRLYQKLDTVREPTRLPAWVATVARNEANAIWRSRKKTVPTEELPLREFLADTIDEGLLETELLQHVMTAFGNLPADGQALLRLLTAVPPLTYDEISEIRNMPKGSIGPIAGRHLDRLRRMLHFYAAGEAL